MWIKTSGDSTNETWIITPKLRLRRSSRARFFLLRALFRFACLHLHVGSRHGISDMCLFTDLNVSGDFGVGITIDLPTVFAFLDRDHGIVYFQHWSPDLVAL